MRKAGAAALISAIVFFPFSGMCADEDWEIGAEAGYHLPQMDISDFKEDYDYGAVIHYWMNDTSTLDVTLSQVNSRREVTVYESGKEESSEDYYYETLLAFVGFRYLPEWDVFFTPYAGMGLGIQQWALRCDLIDDRSSTTLGYYAVLGGEYLISPRVRLGLWSRYVYLPMNDRLEEEFYISSDGSIDLEREDLDSAGFIIFGANLSFKVN